jgi:DNA-binding HxlR family transcriptional regulator
METMQLDCTIYRTLNIFGRKWNLLIILELYKAKMRRYNELKKSLPITSKMLSARLKDLEKEGLVKKHIDSSVLPVRSEYSLTGAGIEVFKILQNIKSWGLKWKKKNIICENKNCADCDF